MERMSMLDAEFLHLEDGIGHLHIGAVGVDRTSPPPQGHSTLAAHMGVRSIKSTAPPPSEAPHVGGNGQPNYPEGGWMPG
jgi:hypothetical protein